MIFIKTLNLSSLCSPDVVSGCAANQTGAPRRKTFFSIFLSLHIAPQLTQIKGPDGGKESAGEDGANENKHDDADCVCVCEEARD